MKDTPKHQGRRKKLADQLAEKGITDQRVLHAIKTVPRHLFLDSSFEDYAYQDQAFPIAANQTISHPFTVAFQSQLLEIAPGDKVLEVGTGSGYQAAVLIEMGAKVYTIERQHELFSITKNLFNKLGYRAKMSFGDGYKGMPAFAPFRKIIVTAGAPYIPEDLLSQLEIGGRMVIPVGDDDQDMILLVRESENDFKRHTFGKFRFVPLLKSKQSGQ
ncbi:MAG: protein-L-isoaspartate(D-aspartate) O-methyltransferase [Schleiferiaceae bacterium]|nr:protein-L-isoaspartate(D-aspartate) O-methyltransferase [Schleiferiaceae bacterium]